MIRTTLTAAAFATCAIASIPAAHAQTKTPPAGNNKLMIVNGNSGRVIYDDGRNDLFCVTRRYTVGYDQYGRRIMRRNMRCR
jgi:lipoprotein-anchoring transpeptidase ErfK/SrfK